MKKRIGLIMVLALLSGLWPSAQVYASHMDAFTFFIPYPTDSLAEFFVAGGQVQPVGFSVARIEHIISISVLRAGTIIYYDEWEDGLESNILFPIQASTRVWGDGDTSNGVAPTVRQPNPDDRLFAGDVIALQNLVPVLRNTADLFFDGGDKIVSAGGSIAVTLAAWPESVATGYPGILFADAWELYPTSRWDTEYIIPIGENVNRPGGGFTIVSLNVQAVEDGTLVDLDLNGDGDFTDPGEVTGYVLNEGGQLNRVEGVNAGAEVRASYPVQVHIFAKDPASTFEARGYTMLPRSQWSDDYLAPRSSDGDFWLYNPDPTNPLVVRVETITGTTAITIPFHSAGRYPPLPAPVLSSPTGVHFTSTDRRPFYGVVALDADEDQDWGYALLPISELATQALIGWAPSNNNNPPGLPNDNESRVYVTAATTTTVFVDYNNDGVADTNYLVLPLAEVPIIDTDVTDGRLDLTGARLYTTDRTPFIAVWGQDQSAPIDLPSIDVGTNIVPLRAPSVQKGYTLIQEGYNCGTVVQGTTVRFELQAFNDSNLPIPDAIIGDTLQAGVAYVPGSTRVRGVPINDSGNTPFPLDEGGYNIGTIDPLGVVLVTYEAIIQDAGLFNNQVEFVSPSADPASIDVTLPFRVVGYDVGKTLIDPSGGVITPGQVITFDLTITNTGNVTITTLPLRDTFDASYLSFRSASVPPDVPGEVAWTDLTSALGDLPPTTTIRVSVSFDVVSDIPSDVISTTNVALAEGVQDSEGRTQAIMCGDASVSFAAPTPTSTPTSTSTPTPTSTSTPTSRTSTPTSRTATPTSRTATPTPTTAISTPMATPTPPVLFLPETGEGYSSNVPWWPLALLPGLGLLVGWAVYRQRRR